MKKITLTLIAALFSAVAAVNAQTTITIKPPQGALDDATISDNFASSNFGTHTEELLLTWTCSGPTCVGRSLMQFNLSAIPANSVINSATLYLYADINNAGNNGMPGQPTYGTDNAGWVRRITQSWNENTVTWNTQPSYTNQNEVTLPQSTSATQDYAANVTALVQDMINNPSSSFGFLLMEKNETTYYNSLIFVSNDNADTARNPKLVITYTQPSGNLTCTETALDVDDEDATIANNYLTSNFGTHPEALAITWTCNSILCVGRGLMRFDLSAIPANALIDSAFLKLYADINNAGNNGIPGQPMYGPNNAGWVRHITQNWSASTVTWNNQPSFTTQNEVVIPQSVSPTQNYVLDVRSMVQDMIMNPSTSHGFIVMMQDEINYYNSLIFCSGDNSTTGCHPRLKICYSLPSGAEELTSGNSFSLYPNPATNEITVQSGKFKVQRIEIINVLGERVYDQQLSTLRLGSGQASNFEFQTVDVSQLPPGIYFVKVKGERGEAVAKFVKQ